jgi:hypothetical protein
VERLERGRELVVCLVAVMAHRRRQVAVAERLGGRFETRGAAHLKREPVPAAMHVQEGRLTFLD